jgi:hypothetical protein
VIDACDARVSELLRIASEEGLCERKVVAAPMTRWRARSFDGARGLAALRMTEKRISFAAFGMAE